MNIAALVESQSAIISSNNQGNLYSSNAATWASNATGWASNATGWASNTTTWSSNGSAFASNASVYTSNALIRNYTSNQVTLNSTWFGLPMLSKSYTVANYATDTVIDSNLKSSTYAIVALGGSALFSNQYVPLPAGRTTGTPGFYVTPYSSNLGLSASTSQTLDRLDLWVTYVQTNYNTT